MTSFTSTFALSLSLLVGCVGDNNANPFPQTCEEAGADRDGDYMLFVDGDEAKQWTAYCADTSKSAKEYLTLPRGGDLNYSRYTAGGQSPGSDVETRFEKVRIDPLTLKVDIGDLRFTTSFGKLMHLGQVEVTAMPFGAQMSCAGGFAGGQINIMGTPFTTDEKLWALGGEATTRQGHAGEWENKQVVELWAEGDCGWIAPIGAPEHPINAAEGSLQLKYAK